MYLMIHGVIVQWYDIDYDSLITQCVIIILSLCQTFSFLSKSSWPTCAALIITVFSSAIISNTAFNKDS